MVVIFDLDGTLANIEHRRHLVTNGNNQWDKFYKECINDEVNPVVSLICKTLKKSGFNIAILSGRSDIVKEETIKWLKDNYIEYDYLYMRKKDDYTPDEKLKEKWLRKLRNEEMVLCIFDDRQKVVDMWREQGFVCFQVAKGDF
jgi:hydroxymethylpyrimidine pyrophosphatase-like HAD family hydrolase